MAHIVVVTGGFTGLFNACLALMQQLQQAGHHITYASPGKAPALLKTLNISFISLPPWRRPVEKRNRTRWQKLRHLRDRKQQAVADLQMDNFGQTLQQLSPDLLLIDIELHPHIMTAVMAKYSVALLSPFISIWRTPVTASAQLPPIHTEIIPGQGWRGTKWGIAWGWLRYSWQKWTAYQRDRWQKVGCDYLSVLQRYSQTIHYPFRQRFGLTQWLVPYPHSTLPILCLHAKEMDFPHIPHPSVQYLGPMVYEAREICIDTPEMAADKATLARFLQQKRPDQPLIYCGCSSFSSASRPFFQQISAIAQQQPNWQFVIGLGGSPYPDTPETLTSNICTLQWAPQLQLLQQANCAVINGGAHSITECIHFGVPMLVIPLSRDDQKGNAARVAYHGIGLVHPLQAAASTTTTPRHHFDPKQLRDRIQQLLEEDQYKARIQKLRKDIQYYAREKIAVSVVEHLLPGEHTLREAAS